ncbi:Metal-dependent hydrolase involved in phosphonate metabolism [Candidatus Rhodobacter oscarellae]|uniref:Metal-dependent hydrolase involved in phosphonate metabolism n=1 Tax=Candidatus Rhodobacter oscarellae TaxID=1675527 RepID=A0A0J9E7K8_9RHOB|nr:alpha-D-ribose 1-methylphosphonate 5-triphosphate diphosphatase [Candidatus Rhodobacter lobularis]KMW58745.1 Metal-dependent hydrolase involved in phosphonate metabolism [Candidatus Rhodobacter lobularis]
MTTETCLANAELVLPTETIRGSILFRDGLIAEINEGRAVPAGAVDCGGDHVAPGLVELHTDNLERHLSPRPKVNWPHYAAIMAHDRELASTGITTVFDALRVGSNPSRGSYPKYAREVATEIMALRARGALKISHHLHLRAEICSETLTAELGEFDDSDRVGIVSLMDHTPGQRQFRDVSKLEVYYKGKHGFSQAEFEEYMAYLRGVSAQNGAAHTAATVSAAARFGATLASHDDTTTEHVAASKSHGASLAEFPTTEDAAQACRAEAIQVIMGAPNLVRGGSHSGNVSAQALAEQDCVDILSSDYIPSSLLLGGAQLGQLWGDMARGIATVTKNPAESAGLADRGALELGRRADVIRFDLAGTTPVLRAAYVQGAQVG